MSTVMCIAGLVGFCSGAICCGYYESACCDDTNIDCKTTLIKNRYKCIDESENECSICLERYRKKDKCVILECEHVYHKTCYEKWEKNSVSCPLCRYAIYEDTHFTQAYPI